MIKISYIIPTYKRAKSLLDTLDSLTKLKFPKNQFEIIVIENDSKKHLVPALKKYKKIFPHFRHVLELKPGLHNGRHKGMRLARAPYLVYLDDDVVVFPGHTQAIVEIFNEKKDIVLIGGKNLPLFESSPPQWLDNLWNKQHSDLKVLDSLSILDFGDVPRVISPYYVFGCNFSIRKSLLLQTNGFHPDSVPQEMDFLQGDGETAVSRYIAQHSYKTYYDPRCSVYHKVSNERMTPHYFYKRNRNQGITDSFSDLKAPFSLLKTLKRMLIRCMVQFRMILQGRYDKVTLLSFIQYLKGYWQHQYLFATNPRIKKWVEKKNYL